MRGATSIGMRQRSNPRVANAVLSSIFGTSSPLKWMPFLRFLADSIFYISRCHPDRWGVSLFYTGIRLNVGLVACLTIRTGEVDVLVRKKTAPPGTRFEKYKFDSAPGCGTTKISISNLGKMLPSLAESHLEAISIAGGRPTTSSIRGAHSKGILELLASVLNRPIPSPTLHMGHALHLLNGGYNNHDKEFLERANAGSRKAGVWTVPKHADIGDEVIINVGKYGFFASAKVRSIPKRRRDVNGNRYGAALGEIRLIRPPISLNFVRKQIRKLKWASYPRSITTPSPEIAEQIQVMVKERRRNRLSDSGELEIRNLSIDELRKLIAKRDSSPVGRKEAKVWRSHRSVYVRKYVLARAKGTCEGCNKKAPFLDAQRKPFLEVHHVEQRAKGGRDEPRFVIALCPNCHRRTDFGLDKTDFNDSLMARLAKIEI